METNLSTSQLEAQARASLEPGFVPPAEPEVKTQPEAVQTQETPTDESVTEQTPAEKQQAGNSDPEPEVEEKEEPPKAEDKPKDEKRESDYSKIQKDEKRRAESWTKLNAEKETWKAEVTQKETQFQAREQRIQQIVAQLESLGQDDGKLPDFRDASGKSYPAELVKGLVKDAFASGEDAQGQQALDALLGLAVQKGNAIGLKPTKEQFAQAQHKLSLARGERPELRAGSGTEHDRVLKQFLDSGPFVDMIAREPDGIEALLKFTDVAVAGLEAPKLKARIAELEKLNGEKSKEVAHYEKTTAPQRAGIARKPAATKSVEELTKADLELKARQVFADAGFR